ncbi:hypothetical protein D3C84_118510 [compost metagenome]
MGAGEGGVDQVADIGMARVHRQLVAFLDHLAHGVDVGEVQFGVQALGVHVQRQGHQVDVAGALAVAEQAALDAVGPGHQAQLGGGDAGATVVVGVQADEHRVAAADVTAEPLDLVGVDVGRGALNGSRQVEDDLVVRGRLPDIDHRVADLYGEIQLGGAEDFRRVLEGPPGFRLLGGQLLDQLGGVGGDVDHALLVLIEDDAAEGRGSGVVDVDDGFLGPAQGLEGAGDQVVTGLSQHLDGHVVGNVAAFDQLAHEVEVCVGGRRESHFDFLQADLDQRLEETHFLGGVHRLDQRLVAVAQVGAAPDRHFGDGLRRPGAVRQVDGGEGAVLAGRVFQHAHGAILVLRAGRGGLG